MGFFETQAQVAALRTDVEFQALQDRDDFRSLITSLEVKVKPKP